MSKIDMTSETKQSLCIKCQACCKSLVFFITANQDTMSFYRARGFYINLTNSREFWIEVPHICKNLSPKGCKIYSKRPLACLMFDGSLHPSTKDKCLWNK